MAAKLDPRIEIIREQYGLEPTDFWELPQKKGTWLAKHSALEIVAAKAGIVFEPPTILEANGGEGTAAICVTGHLGDRLIWSIGEASAKNSRNAYPWAMAEKRAIDRVILKLIGIHGLVYSEDEMSDAIETKPKAQTRDVYAEMQAEIDSCSTIEELGLLWTSKPFQTDFRSLKQDWQDQLTERKDERKADLSTPINGRATVAPNFEGMKQ